MAKKTIAFDFDGVVHSYQHAWTRMAVIKDPPTPGIKELIYNLRHDYKIAIYSVRCNSKKGRVAIAEWLKKYDIKVDRVIREKPVCIVAIDDRALTFNGSVEGLEERIRNFKTYKEKEKIENKTMTREEIVELVQKDLKEEKNTDYSKEEINSVFDMIIRYYKGAD